MRNSIFRISAVLLAATAASYGQVTFTQLHLFPEPGPSAPECTLVETSPGVFYGTTSAASGAPGTFFAVTSGGAFKVLYTFGTATDLISPVGALTQAFDGALYGVTEGGGISGLGMIFQSDLSGSVKDVHDFTDPSTSAVYSLILANDGKLYGTYAAAASVAYVFNARQLIVLHTFSAADGTVAGPLTQASDGNFYGLTNVGIFRLTPQGGFTMLHSFSGNDGTTPIGNMVQARNGRVYGVNAFGGANNWGTVFSTTLGGKFHLEYTFGGPGLDGGFPLTGLATADDGNVYGTTGFLPGSLFRLVTDGTFETLVNFPPTMPGGNPNFSSPAVVQGSDGDLYGVQTTFGGSVYQVASGLNPPMPSIVRFTPASGAAGTKVAIFGKHLLGATSVSFNGALASLVVATAQSIEATVPVGATSGPITVTTPNGASQSEQSFTVTGAN